MYRWLTFQDVLKWWALSELERLGNQEALADRLGIKRTQLGATIRGAKRKFLFDHLETYVMRSKDITRSDLLKKLTLIAWDMEEGGISKKMLEDKIKKASRRGRKPIEEKPPRELEAHEWVDNGARPRSKQVRQRRLKPR